MTCMSNAGTSGAPLEGHVIEDYPHLVSSGKKLVQDNTPSDGFQTV